MREERKREERERRERGGMGEGQQLMVRKREMRGEGWFEKGTKKDENEKEKKDKGRGRRLRREGGK